jgi:phospholipase/lecithinase/hemolysin
MHRSKCVLCYLLAIVLAACGGGGGGDGTPGTAPSSPGTAPSSPQQPAQARFNAQVTFGDSLSDVGSYAVGAVADLGGGQFTINGDGTASFPALTGKNWTQLIAAQYGLPAPCAAQTGLQGDPARGLRVAVVNHPGCFGYAQGGARITEPVGPGNAATGSPIGELTVPIVTQVANHLAAAGGRFNGGEIVFVMAGANDVFVQWRTLAAGAAAAARGAPPEAAAQARADYLVGNGATAIARLAAAGNDLALLVREQIVARGANYVVVNNVPDMAGTPLGSAEEPVLRSLIQEMVESFNRALKAGLDPETRVVQVDTYTLTHDERLNPAAYGLSNTTAPACGPNALDGNSLMCAVTNTYPGVDVSHFMFADTIHPTPYAHSLFARQVLAEMGRKGWL